MKIAMIGQKGIPSRSGGIEIHVEEIAKRLVQKGCEVDVYCRKSYCDEKQKTLEGVNTIFTPYINTKRLDAITHSFTSLIHALFGHNDIIHFHALGPSTLAIIAKVLGKKVVCTVHGLDWKRSKWGGFSSRFLKFGEYATARFAHRTISVSESLVDYYREKYKKNVDYIKNGVEIKECVSPETIREKWGLESKAYFLYLGRLVPEKGIHYLIEAYKRLSTDKKLVIAGGSSHSDDYERELHLKAGDNEKIIFTGFVQGRILEELLSNAFVYVLPSDIEGMPISLLEAMSYGKLCLASDIEENRAVISRYGITFKHRDIDDLSKKMDMILNDEENLNISRSTIIEYIKNNFDWDDAADKTMKLYVELLKKDNKSNVKRKQIGDLY
ncbi:MAG: glycosyltransferase family 4 protein [Acetivibrionales bacterium]|jgi:glycosyltransferase involved in cell wall biosynthesis|nr:glycosyltransferase family 4 protein [Clostridiaceae bacterium]